MVILSDYEVFKKAKEIMYFMEWDQEFIDMAKYLKNLPVEQLKKCIASYSKLHLEYDTIHGYDPFPYELLDGGHGDDPFRVLLLAYKYKTGQEWNNDDDEKITIEETYKHLLRSNDIDEKYIKEQKEIVLAIEREIEYSQNHYIDVEERLKKDIEQLEYEENECKCPQCGEIENLIISIRICVRCWYDFRAI